MYDVCTTKVTRAYMWSDTRKASVPMCAHLPAIMYDNDRSWSCLIKVSLLINIANIIEMLNTHAPLQCRSVPASEQSHVWLSLCLL